MDMSLFEQMLDNLALKGSEEKEKEEEAIALAEDNETPLQTLHRIFETDSEKAFLTPMDIPEYFIEEVLSGRKTPFITERHIELASQYNWDFYFNEILQTSTTLREQQIKNANHILFKNDIFHRVSATPAIVFGTYF